MKYDVGDKVRVFWDGELYPEEVEVIWVSDDEEMFELVGENGNEFQNVTRDTIFYDYEKDKLGMCLVSGQEEIIESISEKEYLEQVKNGEELDWVSVFSDVSLEVLVESVVGNLDDFDSVIDWFAQLLSPYGENSLVYCEEDEMYHMILVG